MGDGGILVGSAPDEIAEGVLYVVSGDSAVEGVVRRGRSRAMEFTWERSLTATSTYGGKSLRLSVEAQHYCALSANHLPP